mmetsp:Transcript_10221/g.17142  ORF Transcript_10221/g.17142 Transcript_10221/m.17142 type:complete len:299 (-) Transcript_10221:502-1398(-)
MTRVDFQNLHCPHTEFILSPLVCLCAHDSLHIGTVAVLAAADNGRDRSKTLGNLHAHDRLSVQLLEPLGKRLELVLVCLLSSLDQVFVFILQFDVLGGDLLELLAIVVTESLHEVLVNSLGEVENLDVSVVELLEERALLDVFSLGAGKDKDLGLPIVHVLNVFVETDPFVARFTGLESQELSELAAVSVVVNDTHFEVVAELLVPFKVWVFLLDRVGIDNIALVINLGLDLVLFISGWVFLGKVADHVDRLADNLLLDNLENLALLESFTVHVEWKVIRVNHTTDESEVARHEIELV